MMKINSRVTCVIAFLLTSVTMLAQSSGDYVIRPNPKPAKPTTGTLSITSTPTNAAIKIDGEYMGTTPLTLKNRKAGTYKVTISAEGYETEILSVTVTAGKTATCSASLKRKQTQQPTKSIQRPTLTRITKTSDGLLDIESFSYVYGVAQTNGLKNYLREKMGVDTNMMDDFLRGFDDNSIEQENSYLVNESDKAEAQMKAFMAGKEIRKQVETKILPDANRQIDKTKDIIISKLFIEGMRNAIAGNPLVDYNEAQAFVNKQVNHYVQEKAEKQYGDNRRAGEAFLKGNAQKSGYHVTASGLQYKILSTGNGRKPKATDKVKVNYEGHLIDGTIFDSSYTRGRPSTFGCNQVIKGWTEALLMMPVGSKWEIVIPQELAYGSRETGKIPPFSCLIYTVELLEIVE